MTLLLLGSLFMLGLLADILASRIGLPRVTLLILAGILAGPSVGNLITRELVAEWFPVLTYCALSMVGFLLGHQLSPAVFRRRGRTVIALAGSKVLGSALVVYLALALGGYPFAVALTLAGVSTATAPAATFDVVRESGARGDFVETLLNIVAFDDALGLIVFSVLLAVAVGVGGGGLSGMVLMHGLTDVGGSLLLGVGLGAPMSLLVAWLGDRDDASEPVQAAAYGFLFVCAGASIALGLSPILASIALGTTVTALARHHRRAFDAIDRIEWPMIILFFLLAGASLHVGALVSVGSLVAVYIVARAAGSWIGTYTAGQVLNLDPLTRNWMGLALMPQAGVALGMALMASQSLPEYADEILTTVLASTVLLELGSPVVTRLVVRRASQAD